MKLKVKFVNKTDQNDQEMQLNVELTACGRCQHKTDKTPLTTSKSPSLHKINLDLDGITLILPSQFSDGISIGFLKKYFKYCTVFTRRLRL